MAQIYAAGSNGQISLDGETLTISRKGAGLLSALTVGLQGDKMIPVGQITAVELRPSGTFIKGYFRLSINGRDPVGGAQEAMRDENAVMIEKKHLPAFTELRDYLVERISRPRQSSGQLSTADEIEKLAVLRDKGILTDAEFTSNIPRPHRLALAGPYEAAYEAILDAMSVNEEAEEPPQQDARQDE